MRTKLFIALFMVSCFSFSQNENEKWDAKCSTYSNFTYGFCWVFPKVFEMSRVVGTEKHTVFKACSPKNIIGTFVNVQMTNNDETITEFYDNYTKILSTIDEMTYNNTGEKIINRTTKLCNFCGRRAIKSVYLSEMSDDRYKSHDVLRTIDYMYMKDGYLFIVTLKYLRDVEKAIGRSRVESILKGYSNIVRY